MKNYYEILEVDSSASTREIKLQFISKMKAYHPDVYKGDRQYAENMTVSLLEAYNTLKDPKLRSAYDKKNHIKIKKNIKKPNEAFRTVEKKEENPAKIKYSNLSESDRRALYLYNTLIMILMFLIFVMIVLFVLNGQ